MKKLSRKQLVIGGVAAVILLPVGLFLWNLSWTTRVASSEAYLSESDLVSQAELVIAGIPVKSKSRVINDSSAGPLIFTDWKFDVRATPLGELPDSLVVTVPGGMRFGQRTYASQFDGFKKGSEYIVYLRYVPETSTWMPLSTTQAVFEKQGTSYVDAAGRSQTLESATALMKSVQK